ncbi:unnamed protein product, partial [Discosporangium mesarthrocarpum]
MSQLYVWEGQVDVLARHLLLLQVVHDWELPLRQRATVFLEIFGNTLVQERTSCYIAQMGVKLEELLYSRGTMVDLIDLSLLKYRERDLLAEVFKSWNHKTPCNITDLRDRRLRHFFGTRYDHRKNLVDWDYVNRVKEVAGIIHHRQYRDWRLEGIAYEFGDQVYNHPNRSMVSFAEALMKKHHWPQFVRLGTRGFWLDIRTGPYITFGVDCERPNKHAEGLFLVLNKGTGTEQQRHNTAEVSVYSVLSCLWELETGTQYLMSKEHDVYSGLGENETEDTETKEN